jgi:tRNA (mo5U34)-methyltransferase
VNRADIAREVQRLAPWHYELDLDGVLTPIRERAWINRHRQRRRYFFEPLVHARALAGKRVLDLGCNAGFWSLQAIEAGAAFVLGVDARAQHVEQAQLVFRARGVPADRYRFTQANVFDMTPHSLGGRFDVVLCLGLLYHVCKPMELLERIGAVNDDLLLIDTTVYRSDANVIGLRHDPLDDPRMSADYELVFLPSPRAVHSMAVASGYACHTLAFDIDDWEGCEDFRAGERYAFACAKRTDLTRIYDRIALSSDRATLRIDRAT